MNKTRHSKNINGVDVRNAAQFKTEINDDGRVCTKCDTFKTWDQFNVAKKVATGRSSSCRECIKSKRDSKPRLRNVKNERERQREHVQWLRENDPLRLKSRSWRSGMRTRSGGLATPSSAEIYEWVNGQQWVCHYTGEKLTLANISIDHKQPLVRGGTNDFHNLCLTSKTTNTTKGTMTEEEFRSLIDLTSTWPDRGAKLMSRLRMAGKAFGPKGGR